MKPINQYIDHTLLKSTASINDIGKHCEEARHHRFFSVCVNGCNVSLAKELLLHSSVKVCSVVGFPFGSTSTSAKVEETKHALKNGADEIDMVINLGFLKSKKYDEVVNDIKSVKNCMPDKALKVIIETCYLDKEEITMATQLAIKGGADFVKTSTGLGTGGATLDDVKLIKSVCSEDVKIKASGGIRDYETALEYLNLGVDRLGTSSGVAILKSVAVHSSY